MAFDLYNGVINDTNIEKKIIRVKSKYLLRQNRLLVERTYGSDYAYNQPIAKIIRRVNELCEDMNLNRFFVACLTYFFFNVISFYSFKEGCEDCE